MEREVIVFFTNESSKRYLEKAFHEINNYRQHIIKQTLRYVQYEQNQWYVDIPTAATADETNNNGKEEHFLLLPYQGK